MHISFFVALLFAIFACQAVFAQKKSDYGSRAIDEKVKNLDESTRKRVLAMQQAGMPEAAIAKKIQYEVGNPGTARKVLERINVEEGKKAWAAQQRCVACPYLRQYKHETLIHWHIRTACVRLMCVICGYSF